MKFPAIRKKVVAATFIALGLLATIPPQQANASTCQSGLGICQFEAGIRNIINADGTQRSEVYIELLLGVWQ